MTELESSMIGVESSAPLTTKKVVIQNVPRSPIKADVKELDAQSSTIKSYTQANSRPVRTIVSESGRATSVKSDLQQVKEAWQRYQSSRKRTGVYIYLGAVFRVVRKWKRSGEVGRNCRLALKQLPEPVSLSMEPYSVVIFCTSDPVKLDAKTRSKFSRALRYAERNKGKEETLFQFMKRRGGINECTALWRQQSNSASQITLKEV